MKVQAFHKVSEIKERFMTKIWCFRPKSAILSQNLPFMQKSVILSQTSAILVKNLSFFKQNI